MLLLLLLDNILLAFLLSYFYFIPLFFFSVSPSRGCCFVYSIPYILAGKSTYAVRRMTFVLYVSSTSPSQFAQIPTRMDDLRVMLLQNAANSVANNLFAAGMLHGCCFCDGGMRILHLP